MGTLLSKLLGSKVTLRERLEKVDKDLRNIQRFQLDTELSQKRWIGRLMIFSSFIYIIAGIGMYLFGPRGPNWKINTLYCLPFIIFPFLIWGFKRAMVWYYKHKIGNNADKYKELKTERQRLLEDVMEFETFNNAKEILEKYDPNRLLPKYLAEQRFNSPTTTTVSSPSQITPIPDTIRRRNLQQEFMSSTTRPITSTSTALALTPQIKPVLGTQGQFMRQTMTPSITQFQRQSISLAGSQTTPPRFQPQFMQSQNIRPTYMTPQTPGNPTLHNRNTGWLDKLVDYVVGDGPQNRYALICRYCATHNGLATPEDFPYTGYRCVFCRQYNPPRQMRPAAEKLPMNTVVIEEMDTDKSGTSTPQSTPIKQNISSSGNTPEVFSPTPDKTTTTDSEIQDGEIHYEPQEIDKENELHVETQEMNKEEDSHEIDTKNVEDEMNMNDDDGIQKEEEDIPNNNEAESISSVENEPFEIVDNPTESQQSKLSN